MRRQREGERGEGKEGALFIQIALSQSSAVPSAEGGGGLLMERGGGVYSATIGILKCEDRQAKWLMQADKVS